MLAFDLGILNRNAHAIPLRESLVTSGAWITLALLFSVFVYCGYTNQWFGLGTHRDQADDSYSGGRTAVIKYLNGYMIELSLSIAICS
jgi:tellurite resistance protein TerC